MICSSVRLTDSIMIALKSSARFQGADGANKLGWIKDTTNSVVSSGVTIIKDSIEPAKTAAGATQQLLFMANKLRDQWQASNKQALATLFDPSSLHFGKFLDLADEGALIDRLADGNDTSKASIKKALWATLIPWAWSLSNEQHHPFIMYVFSNTTSEPELTIISRMPNNIDDLVPCKKASYLDDFIESDDQEDALNCIDGFPYYIVSVKDGCSSGCATTCTTIKGETTCKRHRFRALPGMKQLINETNIWGVTRDEMTQG